VLRGRAEVAATVKGSLVLGRFRKPLSFKVAAGEWRVRIALPRTLVPGNYTVRLDGLASGAATAPEGVVRTYRISSTRNGQDAASFRGVRVFYVSFRFAALPKRGRAVFIDVDGPGTIGGTQKFRAQSQVGTRIRNGGQKIQAGNWRFVLRAGKTVVKRASVQIR
jgi:hypothetical protein